MSWLLRLVMPRTWRRVQCQHLGATARRAGPPSFDRVGGGWCPVCRTELGLTPETIHTLAGKRRR